MSAVFPATDIRAVSEITWMLSDYSTVGNDPLSLVLSKLKNVKKVGLNEWLSCCPAHDDAHPSLGISRGDDGRVLLHCRSQNCEKPAICAAIGIELRDLFFQKGSTAGMPATRAKSGKSKVAKFQTLEDYAASLGGTHEGTWVYTDAQGNPVLGVVRIKTVNDKEFKQLHPVPGGWAFKAPKGTKLPLLYLPELANAEVIYVFEGEKCADAGRAVGFATSTTWAGGCNVVNKTDWSPACGKQVIIFIDNDQCGEAAGETVATITTGLKPSARVKIIRLPRVKRGGDIVDFVAICESDGVEDIKHVIDDLIEQTPEWKPSAKPVKDYPQPQSEPDLPAKHVTECRIPRAEREPGKHLTELWTAERFVEKHGGDIRYCETLGKLFWDGKRWQRDNTGEWERLAKNFVRSLYAHAPNIDDDDQRKSFIEHVKRCESHTKLTSLIALSRSEPGIPVRIEELDADPWLLNVANGTLDLKTGQLRKHDRLDLITKLAPVAFDSNAKCDVWLRSLNEIFSGDIEMIGFVQRALGHALTGVIVDHVLHVLYGVGANGKSTIIETMLGIMGDYACRAARKLLIAKKFDQHTTEIAELRGIRLVSSAESGEGQRLDEEFVKLLTGGDRLKGRPLYRNNFEFAPTHKLFLFTNHRPEVRGQDNSIWRRICLWPFNEVFANPKNVANPQPGEMDRWLFEKLNAERSGILKWCVHGCLQWQKTGLNPPEAVRLATKEYREYCDFVGKFLTECCVLQADFEETGGVLYAVYRVWANENGQSILSNPLFSDALLKRPGIDRIKKRIRCYTGLKLIPEWRQRYDETKTL